MMSRSGFMGRSASLSPQTSHMGPIVRNHSAAAPVAGGKFVSHVVVYLKTCVVK